MARYQVSRRTFMKGAASGLALLALGAPFGAQQALAAGLADEELRTVGLSVTVQERILADFKAKSGVKAVVRQGRDLSRIRRPNCFRARPPMIAGRRSASACPR